MRSSWLLSVILASQGSRTTAFTTSTSVGVPSLTTSNSRSTSTHHRKSSSQHPTLLVPPLFHMGHSHSHHEHQEQKDENKQLSPAARQRKRRRRIALGFFCCLATCGPSLIAKRSLGKTDLIAFVVTAVVLSSADKVRRAINQSIDKLKGYREGIAKHSGGGNNANAAMGINGEVLSAEMQDTSAADRVTWIGVVINLVLSVGKLVIGITNHSSVLIADAGHSLSDLVSDFITLWSVQIARLPPDDDHPYGHYKFEAIGSLFLSLTLLATGVSVGIHSNVQLIQLLNKKGSATMASVVLPGPLALVMAAVSIASKEWLFRITKVVGERLNSPVVIANAWHHRSDAYSSVLALLSIAWAMTGFAAADAAAGMLVAGMICMTGGDILVESIQQLSDSSNEELHSELKIMVDDYVQHHDDDVLHTTSIRARQVGSSAFVDITVETPPELSTTATRAVEERIKRVIVQKLQDSGRLISATVHAKPLMVICPLLEQRRETNDAVTATTSASQIEYMVRQQALLLYPKIDSIPAVTVHYSAQREVTVDVKIVASESTSSVVDVQQHARELQEHLEELPEIDHAHIYLDLNAINNTAEQENGNGEPDTAIPTTTSQNSNTTATLAP